MCFMPGMKDEAMVFDREQLGQCIPLLDDFEQLLIVRTSNTRGGLINEITKI